MQARFPIAVKVWAGDDPRDFHYVSRSLPSLLASDLPEHADVVVFNDRSTHPRLAPFLRELQSQDSRVRVVEHEVNKGPNQGQADAFDQLKGEYPDAEFFVSVDDDAVYHRDWLNRAVQAMNDVRPQGKNGVFTSFNTPFRQPHTTLQAGGQTYHLKWKQPATNWLIPRDVLDRVGPFRDEGIAFDTVYSHRMRLLGYSVICPTQSYVQDIGLSGAYAVDNRLCADRFVGEGAGDSWWQRGLTWSRYHAARLVRELKELRHRQPRILWPVRWGTDWLYEAVGEGGQSVALWSTDADHRRGWSPADVSGRAREILATQPGGPFALRRVHYSRNGEATLVESGWKAMPNLREAADLFPERLPAALDLLHGLALQLLPFHSAGVAHGKVRPENVFIDLDAQSVQLAWLGPEAPQSAFDPKDRDQCRKYFGDSVDGRCRDRVRDEHAGRVMTVLAPEFRLGCPATFAGDIYAAAATVRRVAAAAGREADSGITNVLEQCLASTPELRPHDAMALLKRLGATRSLTPQLAEVATL